VKQPVAHISVFTRLPLAGQSKTRLIPVLGAEGAATLQRDMTAHVVRQARFLAATDGVTVEVRIADGSCTEARRWLGAACAPQGDGDLGDRLERALVGGSARARVALVVGGDCPAVSAADLRICVRAAEEHGAAIIPATDGGFCALALAADVARDAAGLLHGCEWGGERVCAQALKRVRERCPDVAVLPARDDVDRSEDLPAWERVRRAWYEPPELLAVVIPVLNEARSLPPLIASLLAEDARVIVADGGSTDGSAEAACNAGATVIEAARGRAAQQNAGAAAAADAGADALLFLHADTSPPAGFARLTLSALADPGVVLGAYGFSLGATTPALRVIEANTRLRVSLGGIPYGDQGLFCRRVAFEALGGFPELPVMEDYEFVRRARRAGEVRVLPERARTSDRRWREQGVWRWSALNMATVARYRMGTSAEELAAWRAAHSKR